MSRSFVAPRTEGSGRRTRIRYSARTLIAVVGLCAAVALTAAGCGSSGDSAQNAAGENGSAAVSTTAESGQASQEADASGLTPDEKTAITGAFEKFFSGQSDADTKLGVIEDPDRFTDTIRAQSDSGLAKSTSVTVSDMSLVAPGRASVSYTILMDDKPVLPDQAGYAVQVDGGWKVSASSFCGLLTLENGGTPPPECAAEGGPAGAAPTAPSTPTS